MQEACVMEALDHASRRRMRGHDATTFWSSRHSSRKTGDVRRRLARIFHEHVNASRSFA